MRQKDYRPLPALSHKIKSKSNQKHKQRQQNRSTLSLMSLKIVIVSDAWHPQVGGLDENLDAAIEKALSLPREGCREFALNYSWEASCQQFVSHLATI